MVRPMRLLLPLLLLAAACGDYSNEDLVFRLALPERAQLEAALPETPQAQALTVGLHSDIAMHTRGAVAAFNGALDALLAGVERVRELPPTRRAPGRREWGPWPDRAHPGWEARFVMERDGERFDYRLEYRPARAGEDAWFALLVGGFLAHPEAGGAADGLRGEGELHLLVADARERGLWLAGLGSLATLDVGYRTHAPPTRVELHLVAEPGPLGAPAPEVVYAHRALAEGPSEMRFKVLNVDVTADGVLEDLVITSRWTREGAGRASVLLEGGNQGGAEVVECWDAAERTVYERKSWDPFGASGRQADCPDVSALDAVR